MNVPLIYAKKYNDKFLVFIEYHDSLSVEIFIDKMLHNEKGGLSLLACYHFERKEWRGLTWFDDREKNTGLDETDFFNFLNAAVEDELNKSISRYKQRQQYKQQVKRYIEKHPSTGFNPI